MAISSSNISPAQGSSSSSSSKLEQRKLKFFKKKMVGPAKKRVLSRPPIRLIVKTTSPMNLEAIDNTRMLQQCGSSGHGEVKSPAMDRALEIQAKLPSKFPSFVKYMLKSHVTGGFWLGLPKPFCDLHMPKRNETILLVGEGVVEEYRTNYLREKNGLSGGWRGFSLAHNLLEGDVLVFQHIESLKFKVYMVRASQAAEVNEAASLLNLHSQAKALDITHSENELEDVKNVEMIVGDKCMEVCEMENHQEDGRAIRRTEALDSEPVAVLHQTRYTSDELGSEDGQDKRLAKSILEFKDVKGFDSFSILVDGLVIDSEIPIHLRYKYYKLCRDQNSFLHDDLVKGLNCKLACGIISETVNIADAINAATLTVSLERLQSLDKTLKAFEDMGMKVGFLRACINKLEGLLYEQHEIIRSKKLEQAQLEAEIRDLESKFLKRYEAKKALDDEIEALMVKNSSLEVTLKNTDTAAW